jgi:hypothetical protein
MKKYKYEGILPPTLYTNHKTGKKYIVPAWTEVPLGTTLSQIEWTKTKN